MSEAVDYTIGSMEFWRDDVEQLRVPDMISSKHCVGYVICNLDDPGGTRVREKWNVSEVVDG